MNLVDGRVFKGSFLLQFDEGFSDFVPLEETYAIDILFNIGFYLCVIEFFVVVRVCQFKEHL